MRVMANMDTPTHTMLLVVALLYVYGSAVYLVLYVVTCTYLATYIIILLMMAHVQLHGSYISSNCLK